MTQLPTGTVTFLFTDIERSTERVAAVGDAAYADVLAEHHRILREVFSRGGSEIKTEGDAFFIAFARPADAVSAAVEAQRALAAHTWPGDELAVRMGIHTGEAVVQDNDYVGLAVHQAKRICDAGHGGQILVSTATAALVDGLADITVVDLGPHTLKDLLRPEHLHQVSSDGLRQDFPKLRSLDLAPNNLPHQVTTFIGRTTEVQEVTDLLSTSRVVTITGAGGSGKTRLALQVAADLVDAYPDGIWLVDLSAISDGDLIAQHAATALGLGGMATRMLGAPTNDRRPPLEAIVDYLRSKRLLLLMDNCEHLVSPAASIVEQIVTVAPEVRVLVTSREALRVSGETAWRIPSLVTDGASSDAVRLFTERALAIRPGFSPTSDDLDAIEQICRRLDGIPLAIELAVARLRVLSPVEIASRLEDMFRLLTGGARTALERQQTLRATVDWSFDLLTEPERTLLRRLAVFVGGFTLEAAEAVCGMDPLQRDDVMDLIEHLVDKSLLVADLGPTTRYIQLETIRQYAREKLFDAKEGDAVRERHRDHFLEMAERLADPVTEAAKRLDEIGRVIAVDYENLRAALEWSIGRRDTEHVFRFGWVLYGHWFDRMDAVAFRSWIVAVEDLGVAEDGTLSVARARALVVGSAIGSMMGIGTDERRAAWADKALDAARDSGDDESLTLALLGASVRGGIPIDVVYTLRKEALEAARRTGSDGYVRSALFWWGGVLIALGKLEEAEGAYQELFERGEAIGDPEPMALRGFARIAWRRGDGKTAAGFAREAVDRLSRIDSPGVVGALNLIAWEAFTDGADLELSAELAFVALEAAEKHGQLTSTAGNLHTLGEIARLRGDHRSAHSYYDRSLMAADAIADHWSAASALFGRGYTLASSGDPDAAERAIREALARLDQLDSPLNGGRIDGALGLAAVAIERDDGTSAARLLGGAHAMRELLALSRTAASRDWEDGLLARAKELAGSGFDDAYADGRSRSFGVLAG